MSSTENFSIEEAAAISVSSFSTAPTTTANGDDEENYETVEVKMDPKE